ncbi:sensor histidine kinase [Futiania mangrovi]|uniref:histidine kinase n=1 Tax=Futiania mangrovi TaxID=2959716 RepID=A0A9J6PEA4_9PROT|nr:ATP-binding protein [Futiania mangrovii]MCP1336742.1 ATP-binding protein [Futiania mangrovii]
MTTDLGRDFERRYNRFTLRFHDADVEARYVVAYLSQSLPIIRIALLLGALLFAVFGVLDQMIASAYVHELYAIRFMFVCPVLLLAFMMTYTRWIWSHSQLILSIAMATSGFSIIMMTAIIDAPARHLYYGGLVISLIYCGVVLRIHFMRGAIICGALFVCYIVTATLINPIPSWALANNVFFLSVAAGVTVFSSYALDHFMRSIFVQNEVLAEARRQAEALQAKAEAANHAKSQFLATMSHELRTPLNAIIGFSEMMMGEYFGPLGNERYKAYTSDIHKSGRFLCTIIDDILDLSKAEAGTLRVEAEDIDLARLAEDTMTLFRDQAAEKQIALSMDPGDGPHMVHADPRLMRQLLVNLLTNAMKFTEAGGRIDLVVAAADGGGGTLLVVRDTGCGIPTDEQERVFEPFVQLEDAFARSKGGAGLGLPLVKKIVDLHDAELDMRSTPDVGTEFRISFAAAPGTPADGSGDGRRAGDDSGAGALRDAAASLRAALGEDGRQAPAAAGDAAEDSGTAPASAIARKTSAA